MAQLFPPTGVKEDSSKFGLTVEDKTIKSDTDGGYVYTRPRHGRLPRRTFSTGFSQLTPAQKVLVMNFVNIHGQYLAFDYDLPDTGERVSVRFTALPTLKYVGVGGTHIYDINGFKMTEV